MSELDFALDGLYAAGWWPSESDPCLRSQDDRWYPSLDLIRANFAKSGIELHSRTAPAGHPFSVTWEIPGHGQETVTARTEESALLLAFTELYRVQSGATLAATRC